MTYITRQDDISAIPLSVRSTNCLRRADIHTIGALLDYPAEELINLRNMGKKSVDEIQHWVTLLLNGSDEYMLVEHADAGMKAEKQGFGENRNTVLIDENGAVTADIPIAGTELSVRSQNCLTNAGIRLVSQLMKLSADDLMNLKNMGRKSVDEVLAYLEKIKITYAAGEEPAGGEAVGSLRNEIVAELTTAYGQEESVWARELLTVKAQYPEALGETLTYRLYESPLVRATAKTVILQHVEANGGELSKNSLAELLPVHVRNTTVLEELLLELEAASAVELGEVMIRRQYPSVNRFAAQIRDERVREVLQARLEGKTLQEIGEQFGITRERVRQLSMKSLRGKPYLREDRLAYLYDHYDFSAEDLLLAFDEPKETYYYLEMISTNSRAKRKPLEELLTDASVDPDLRRRAERAIYKKYITVDGVRIRKDRPTMVRHFVKTYCRELTKFDDFVEQYHAWLAALDLNGETGLILESRTYENHLHLSEYALWNQWRSFRYYNISEQDYGELLSTLDLNSYEDTEISALKLFRDYPALMAQYDIRDEYELHNLLKKIWPADDERVLFTRMPTIEIGAANRDDQILSLLLQYAPISAEEFGKKYEEAYGAKAATVLGSYMGSFDQYFYNGVYSISSDNLPPVQFERMKTELTEAFYLISDIKRLFLREFPDADPAAINPYTLKTLGFRVNSGYVVKNEYASAADYFRTLLTKTDIVDAREIRKEIQRVVAYSSELYSLRSSYEIVEFAPLQYINLRRLNEVGISVDALKRYCGAVAAASEKGDYFTVKSLYQDGFTHELDDLGFDEWFYSSVLIEDRERFSYQRVGGTRVILRGKQNATLGGMLTWLLEKHQKLDLYDLLELLQERYGVVLPREKIIEIINGTELYYDAIMEAVYIDYDTYFEEI